MEDIDRVRIGGLQTRGVGGVGILVETVELQLDEGGGQADGIAGLRHAADGFADAEFAAEPADQVDAGRRAEFSQLGHQRRLELEVEDHLAVGNDLRNPQPPVELLPSVGSHGFAPPARQRPGGDDPSKPGEEIGPPNADQFDFHARGPVRPRGWSVHAKVEVVFWHRKQLSGLHAIDSDAQSEGPR